MSQAPSLFGDATPSPAQPMSSTPPAYDVKSLLDLLYDGFFMLFLLKRGREPENVAGFLERIRQFLSDFERGAKKMNVTADDIYMSKFAFCAAIDESVLASSFSIRNERDALPAGMNR